jgi:hypothetical protein
MGIGNPDRAPVPTRHWRSYGNDPLPTGQEALDEPFRAFPSWFLRIECDRCGKVQMVNEAHAARWRDRTLRAILARMRHDGCGGSCRSPTRCWRPRRSGGANLLEHPRHTHTEFQWT